MTGGAKSHMGGTSMRHATARGSVNRLVLMEPIFKRLSMRPKTNFKLTETGIPKIVLDPQCAPATDDVTIVLGCAERQCVFEGAAGQLYSSSPGPHVHMMPAIRDFFENSLFLWIKPENLLCYTEEDTKQDLASGITKVFMEPPAEANHCQDGGHFGTLFAVVLTQSNSQKARIGVTTNSSTKGQVKVVHLNCYYKSINWKYPFLNGPERGLQSDS